MVLPVVVYGCESWTIKTAERRRIDAFELWCWRRLESPLDCKEIQPVHPKGDQSWVFIGRTDVEAETPILWPPDAKNWLTGKDPDAGKDFGQEEKGTTEDEMVGWHHQLNGHRFRWTPGVGSGQGGLVCCSSWGRKELDTAERLNWIEGVNWTELKVNRVLDIQEEISNGKFLYNSGALRLSYGSQVIWEVLFLKIGNWVPRDTHLGESAKWEEMKILGPSFEEYQHFKTWR